MAINYPGPYEVEFIYNVTIGTVILPHYLRVNCAVVGTPAPGTAMSAINVMTKAGTPAGLEASILAFWNWYKIQLGTTVTVGVPSLYKYDTGTFVKNFVSAYGGTALTNGTGTSGIGDSHEMIQTYRTAAGGILKLTWLEDTNGTLVNRAPLVANAAGTNDAKLAAYMISSAAWIIGRDDSFPIASMFNVFGQNEAVFKKRHR